MSEPYPTYKIAMAPPLAGKIPYGSPFWKQFNGSFDLLDEEPQNIAARIYEGQPLTTWHKDKWRTGANYILGQHIGMDFDTGDKQSSVPELLKDKFIAKYASILYTTPSHTPEAPRARVLFLLDTPIHQPQNYVLAVSSLLWLYGTADKQCKDPVRFFYGGKPKDCTIEWHPDKVLPLAVVKDMIQQFKLAGAANKRRMQRSDYQPRNADEAEVKAALDVIPENQISYDEWLAVLMAIDSEFGDAGIPMAEKWGGGKPGEIRAKFKSFKSNGNETGKVTIASVFHLAKQFGYEVKRAN